MAISPVEVVTTLSDDVPGPTNSSATPEGAHEWIVTRMWKL